MVAVIGVPWSAYAPPASGRAATRPNVLVIVTDDQTLNTVSRLVMPNTYHWFVDRGESLPHFYAADPLCCPSRASIMTGRYDHNNGVKDNSSDTMSFHLDMQSEIQCYLQQSGYYTGLYGKFYNGYNYHKDPPCLSDYAITRGDEHTDLWFRVDGVMKKPPGWQDDYIAHKSLVFLNRRAQHPGTPWYLYMSTLEPHSPYSGLPGDVATKPVPAPFISPSVDQSDLSGLSPTIRTNATQKGYNYTNWNAENRMLMNVDSYVGQVFHTLQRNRQLQNTLVFFVSDNGFLFGEHHLSDKRLPYTESTGVPAYVYGPRWVTPGSSDKRLAENVDITPTIIQATGIHPQLRYPIDGRSLIDPTWKRTQILGESWHLQKSKWQPRWRGIRTKSYQYIEYLTDGPSPTVTWREYYNLNSDPFEMHNVLVDDTAANDPDVAALHLAILADSRCKGTTGARACP